MVIIIVAVLSVLTNLRQIDDLLINQRLIAPPMSKAIGWTERDKQGLAVMRNGSAVFLGVGRNVALTLPPLLQQLAETAALFDKSRAIFVEGDSTDATGDVLRDWAAQSPGNRTIFTASAPLTEEDGPEAGSKLPREGQLASARNVALDALYAEVRLSSAPPDFVLVLDLDVVGWDLKGLVDSFRRHTSWDVACAHGILLHGIYRDTYALRAPGIDTNHHRSEVSSLKTCTTLFSLFDMPQCSMFQM